MNNKVRKYLFVCQANMERSPTAERVFRKMAEEKGVEIEVESAGLTVDLGSQLTKEIADRADRIFVMEDYMKKRIVDDYLQNPEKIFSLNIPDIYKRDEPELVSWLEEKLMGWLEIEN